MSTKQHKIIEATASHFGVKVADLRSRCLKPNVKTARWLAMWLVRQDTGASFPRIGHVFGGRCHACVMRAVAITDANIAQDAELQSAVAAIRRAVGEGESNV